MQTEMQHPLLDRVRECSASPDQAASFFQQMLHPDPPKRLSAVDHPWLADTACSMLADMNADQPAHAVGQSPAVTRQRTSTSRLSALTSCCHSGNQPDDEAENSSSAAVVHATQRPLSKLQKLKIWLFSILRRARLAQAFKVFKRLLTFKKRHDKQNTIAEPAVAPVFVPLSASSNLHESDTTCSEGQIQEPAASAPGRMQCLSSLTDFVSRKKAGNAPCSHQCRVTVAEAGPAGDATTSLVDNQSHSSTSQHPKSGIGSVRVAVTATSNMADQEVKGEEDCGQEADAAFEPGSLEADPTPKSLNR